MDYQGELDILVYRREQGEGRIATVMYLSGKVEKMPLART